MSTMSQGAAGVTEHRASRNRLMIGVTLVLLLREFAHILLGALLLVLGLVRTIVAVAGRTPGTAVLSAAGLLVLLVAWIGGDKFLSGGGHSVDSYMMAAGFVLAAVCYAIARDLDGRSGT